MVVYHCSCQGVEEKGLTVFIVLNVMTVIDWQNLLPTRNIVLPG